MWAQTLGRWQAYAGSWQELDILLQQAKRLRKSGQLIYARAAQEGLRMVIFCDGYPKVRVSKDYFVSI